MKKNESIHRHDISDEAWERIKELLPDRQENAENDERQASIH